MLSKDALGALPAPLREEILRAEEKVRRGEISQTEYRDFCNRAISEHKEMEEDEETSAAGEQKKQKEEQKPEYMSDIIHYVGVNLKEEAQHIQKETESAFLLEESQNHSTDHRNSIESLFEKPIFVFFVNKICKLREVTVADGAQQIIFQAVRRRLLDLLEKLIEQSKARVDLSRADYLIRIENDRKRQMWFLEQEERLEMDKYRHKKEGDEGEGKKKWRKILQEREDLIIKKRLSNNVALAALGSQPKSWMSASRVAGDDGSAPYLSLFQGQEERNQKGGARIITKEDFLAVLSRDKRYNKSVFTIKHTYL